VDIATAAGTAGYAYLVGSIPAAYLIARMARGVDVRAEGEGNVGARNVFHVVGPHWGVVSFLADFGKGVAVALPFREAPAAQLAIAGVFLVVGHGYPVWLRFVGGKGLASAGGFAAALMPIAAAMGSAVGLVALAVSRRFLPSVVPAILVMIVAAPFTGIAWQVVAVSLGTFVVVGLKRALDEPRMRTVEAQTGWDRARGGVA
jgi:glycerol-3-phosphate acyltransferase PlsY